MRTSVAPQLFQQASLLAEAPAANQLPYAEMAQHSIHILHQRLRLHAGRFGTDQYMLLLNTNSELAAYTVRRTCVL